MPSPAGHSLIGFACGAACCLPRCGSWRQLGRRLWRWRGLLLMCVVLANAPDIDYLFGLAAGDLNSRHQLITHTLGWITVVAVCVWSAQRYFPRKTVRMSLGLIFLLLASHLAADYFGSDTRPPLGIMALWPFSSRFYLSPWPVFPAPSKTTLGDLLSLKNLFVVLTEIAFVAPFVLLALASKIRRPKQG